MYKVYYNINTIHVESLNQIIMSEIVDNKKNLLYSKNAFAFIEISSAKWLAFARL